MRRQRTRLFSEDGYGRSRRVILRLAATTLICFAALAATTQAASLSVGNLNLTPGSSGSIVISGQLNNEMTFGVTVLIELVPRAGATGTVSFTASPPADIVQLGDPWPGFGTFSPFDTDQTSSSLLNGAVDDNGTFTLEATTFAGPLVQFPITTSGNAQGVWDVVLNTSQGSSTWEQLTTTLTAGTVTVAPSGCTTNPQCDDGLFCNGAEVCAGGNCTAGSDPCPAQLCDEGINACVACVVDGDCNDGLFCTGAESCVSGNCQSSGDPCPGQFCDEVSDTCALQAAQLSVGSLTMAPGATNSVVVSGAIDGDSTYGVTLFVEILPRSGNAGTVTFTTAPPVDITQLTDPWPGAGTFTVFDTNLTGSGALNGAIDDNGTFIPGPLTFSGDLASFPVRASSDAGGTWDVVLSTSSGDSIWEGVTTVRSAGTITVVPSVSVSVTSFAMPPGATTGLIVSGNIEGQSTYGVTVLVELIPRAGNAGTLAFTSAPPVDITQLGDPWPGVGFFSPFDTDVSGSPLFNGSVDDNGTFITAAVTFSGPLARYPLVASSGANGVWDVRLQTTDGNSGWEGLTTVRINGTVMVSAGACLVNTDCDDANPCTNDVCTLGACGHSAVIGSCDDGDLCTINDTCVGTLCSGNPVDCSGLSDVCNLGLCNGLTGLCEASPVNEGGGCDDADPCTEIDICTSGACAGSPIPGCINCGTPIDCDDANVCTDEDCVGGVCAFANNALACDDGDACTTGDTCSSGACVGGPAPVCDDGNPCTDDSCDSLIGCDATNNANACNDGDPCTSSDACGGGVCAGTFIPGCVNCSTNANCNDNNACTSESCVGGACVYVNLTNSCNDGSPCTLSDACSGGACVGTPKNCSSLNNTCNVGSCNATSGACEALPTNEGGSCNDGLSCTINDACVSGQCKGTLVDPLGVDLSFVPSSSAVQVGANWQVQLVASSSTCATMPVGSVETILRWDPTKLQFVRSIRPTPAVWEISWFPNDSQLDGLNAPFNGTITNDGNAFWQGIINFQTGVDVPPGGRLLVTFEFLALDGTPATTVSVDPTFGSSTQTRVLGAKDYVGQNLTAALPSTVVDVNECSVAADCNDGNVCTTDACNAGVCEYANNTLSCNDGLFCTSGDTCSAGVCVGGANPCTTPLLCSESLDACVQCLSAANCNDGNVCTTDTCNASGSCVFTNNTSPCNDNQFCTSTDVCSGGACVGSGNTCPGLICDEPTDRCVQCLSPSDCNDGNLCTNDVCTSNVCSNPNNSNPCSDGAFCTSSDTCSGGACVGGPNPCAPPSFCNENFDACVQCLTDAHCDDGNVCTTDQCSFGTCVRPNNTLPCDDGVFCTANDVCGGGACVGSGNRCPGLLCDESGDQCVECFTVADCPDDGIPCTVNQCNNGQCDYVPNNAACDDGTFCNGAEFCNAASGCVTPGNPCDDPALCNETTNSCACRPVLAVDEGSRYIAVTPRSGNTPVALRVNGVSPGVSCVVQYVQADGRLGTSPVYRVPGLAGWSTVHVRGANIRPSAIYEVRSECQTGAGLDLSTPVQATTWSWADTDDSGGLVVIIDLVRVVDAFRGIGNIPLYSVDLWGADAAACLPQRVVDVFDMTRAIDAFRQLPFPCVPPCP